MAVERDHSIVKVSELSKHGLMEITRKRVTNSQSAKSFFNFSFDYVPSLAVLSHAYEMNIIQDPSMLQYDSMIEKGKKYPNMVCHGKQLYSLHDVMFKYPCM